MRTEVPVFRRCCFCLPVRYGLLLWGYLNLLLNGLILTANCYECYYMIHFNYRAEFSITIFIITLLVNLINIALTFLLIVAAHKKNLKLLRISYGFALISAAAYFLLMIINQVYNVVNYFNREYYRIIVVYLVYETLTGIMQIGFQLYIVAMVRSEILKLESNHQFRFMNHAAEAECAYYDKQDEPIAKNDTQLKIDDTQHQIDDNE